jgi:hypothetical protein
MHLDGDSAAFTLDGMGFMTDHHLSLQTFQTAFLVADLLLDVNLSYAPKCLDARVSFLLFSHDSWSGVLYAILRGQA